MSARVWCALLGVVFAVVWANLNIGWAVVVLVCALIGYAVGAALEGSVNLAGVAAQLRPPRR